jgi:hypothetical protein
MATAIASPSYFNRLQFRPRSAVPHREWVPARISAMARSQPKSKPHANAVREYCRISRLLCELSTSSVRLSSSDGPVNRVQLTRGEIAERLGISLVRTKRALGLLVLSGAIRMDQQGIELLDWERLCRVAGLDPAGADSQTAEQDAVPNDTEPGNPASTATLCGDPACFV